MLRRPLSCTSTSVWSMSHEWLGFTKKVRWPFSMLPRKSLPVTESCCLRTSTLRFSKKAPKSGARLRAAAARSVQRGAALEVRGAQVVAALGVETETALGSETTRRSETPVGSAGAVLAGSALCQSEMS
eukprot:Gregarina_sp_Pseudo_9__5602@NODE_765_length_2245_cov_25_783772_g720_i0_p5_GENE_NODE_765_length_2245_cov_25_783772_g720_i0NODE_765_length_2245_cov_25_783772_g720_i0_p5_ORF_typecomplete_len129_score28_91DUF963/PF06131_11/2DUF963/PF06131_11/1_1e02_NODE_765_length_2245_cov_25_783772_g720_i016202006